MKSKQITVAIIGAGGRGRWTFAPTIRELAHKARVVAVAEPRAWNRNEFAREFGLKKAMVFKSWRDFVKGAKKCDAVVISTMDQEHAQPALACLEKGYHVLLEKPMAVTLEDCRAIEAAQRKSGKVLAVCHSLRYSKGFSKLKEVIDSGKIGEVVTLDHLEGVGYWHQAHSFVRANWRNEKTSTFMLLSKSCHDIDFLYYLTGKKFLRVSSYGSLKHFTPGNAPKGATRRCTDGCPAEPSCPYSALKIYRHHPFFGKMIAVGQPHDVFVKELAKLPVGRCVYYCDNDVVDHQVVLIEAEDGVTISFTMTAFTHTWERRTRVHGTGGELTFNENSITIHTFGEDNVERIEISPEAGGHGGGDLRVTRNWLEAIEKNKPSHVLATAQESLLTHTYTFAAEKARKEKRIVEMSEML